jgi:hypothetical protein
MRFISEIGALVAAYLLIATGVLSLLIPAYYVWDLYLHPQHISVFADMFQATIIQETNATDEDKELFRLFAWPVVVFLLLIQARIGVWAIDSAAHLLDIVRKTLNADAEPDY